jgi:protoporphyrinogen oxidase
MIYILGGGPTGISVAHELNNTMDAEFILIEKGNKVGGLASTINWEPHGLHDLGPHKIFSIDKELEKKVKLIIGDENWITKEKKSKIFLNGKLINYPPSPFVILRTFGIFSFTKFVFSFLYQKFYLNYKPQKINSYKDHLITRVGSQIFENVFKPITEKIWGDPSILDKKLSETRVQLPSIFDMLLLTIGIKKKNNFEANEFIYPKNGLNKIWEKIKSNIDDKNFHLETTVKSFSLEKNKVNKIYAKKNNEDVVYTLSEQDVVINTLPLNIVQNSFKDTFGEKFIEESNKILKMNDLFLVFLSIKKSKLFDESWLFVADKKLIFHRVSEQKSFDDQMVKNDRTIVCCEVMINKFNNEFSDEEIINKTIEDLSNLKKDKIEVLDKKLIKLFKSYPVYQKDYEIKLKSIIDRYDSVENFYTIGRQGSFNYIGTLDCMDIGFGFVKWFKNKHTNSWEDERKRTDQYPILD